MASLRQIEYSVVGGSDQGALNGTASVDIVPAAPSGFTRVVERIAIFNADTAAVDVTMRVTVPGPTDYVFDRSPTLGVGAVFAPVSSASELRLVTGEKVTAIMGAAAATTNPSWISCWRDEPTP